MGEVQQKSSNVKKHDEKAFLVIELKLVFQRLLKCSSIPKQQNIPFKLVIK